MSALNSLSLSNKVAIVTGSGRENGIGAAIALTLARAGARVTINYVSESSTPRALQVVATIESAVGKGKVHSVKADVSTPKGTKQIVDETLEAFGVDHIDIIGKYNCAKEQPASLHLLTFKLVNNATFARTGSVLSSQREDILRSFEVAVVGPVLLLQAAYPYIPQGGRVINIGSVASKLGFVQMPIYAAAKAAMDQLTFSLSREVSKGSLIASSMILTRE